MLAGCPCWMIIALVVVGCRVVPCDPTEDQRAGIEQEIRDSFPRWFRTGQEAHDPFWNWPVDPEAYMYHDGQRFDMRPVPTIPDHLMPTRSVFEDVEIHVLDRDAAWASLRFRDEPTEKATTSTLLFRGAMTLIFRRHPTRGWLLLYLDVDHYDRVSTESMQDARPGEADENGGS